MKKTCFIFLTILLLNLLSCSQAIEQSSPCCNPNDGLLGYDAVISDNVIYYIDNDINIKSICSDASDPKLLYKNGEEMRRIGVNGKNIFFTDSSGLNKFNSETGILERNLLPDCVPSSMQFDFCVFDNFVCYVEPMTGRLICYNINTKDTTFLGGAVYSFAVSNNFIYVLQPGFIKKYNRSDFYAEYKFDVADEYVGESRDIWDNQICLSDTGKLYYISDYIYQFDEENMKLIRISDFSIPLYYQHVYIYKGSVICSKDNFLYKILLENGSSKILYNTQKHPVQKYSVIGGYLYLSPGHRINLENDRLENWTF